MKLKTAKNLIIISLVIFVQLLLLFVAAMFKDGFNIDDILSFQLSNSFYLPYLELSTQFYNEWHDTIFFMEALTTTSESTSFIYSSVLYNQMQDVHPPLYYFALHTVCSIFRGVFSKWLGLSINFLFFAGTSFFLYKISQLFFKNIAFILLPVVLWGFSISAFSTFLLIRMYMMLCFVTVLYLYIHLRYVTCKKIQVWQILAIIASVLLGFMTHYYFLIFAFFVAFAECLIRLIKKEFIPLLLYATSTLCAVGLGFVLYPAAYSHIFLNYRGEESAQSLLQVSSYATRFLQITTTISPLNFTAFLLSLLAIAFIIFCFFKDSFANSIRIAIQTQCTEETGITCARFFIIAFSAFYTFALVTVLAGYEAERYLYYTYPSFALILSITLVLFFSYLPISEHKKQIFALALAVCLLGFDWYGKVPSYLEQDSAAAIANSQQYTDASCVYVIDKTWKFVGHYLELASYEQVAFLKQTSFEEEITNLDFSEADTLLLYLPNGTDSTTYCTYLQEELDYSAMEFLWSYAYSDVYKLTK